jgi:hypothetical protein
MIERQEQSLHARAGHTSAVKGGTNVLTADPGVFGSAVDCFVGSFFT